MDSGYSATDEDNVAAAWVAHYSTIPPGRIMVPGYFADTNLGTVGADSRLRGALLSVHDYTLGGQSHPTEAACGVNYYDARDGTNDV